MLSEKKVTKYLKAKDLDDSDKKQLQKELNTMIKQRFGRSHHTGKFMT